MNKVYEDQYRSNCTFIGTQSRTDKKAADEHESIFEVLSSSKAMNVFHVICSVIFFVAFIGIIGGMDAGTVPVGVGITVSIFMFFIEIVCFGIKLLGGSDKRQ